MTHLLDTDTCIHLLRGRGGVPERVAARAPDELAVSAITCYELRFGVLCCPPERHGGELAKINYLLNTLHILPFTKETAVHAAGIRAALESIGQPIGPMDTLIAACALECRLILVSGNLREFTRIPDLACESWL